MFKSDSRVCDCLHLNDHLLDRSVAMTNQASNIFAVLIVVGMIVITMMSAGDPGSSLKDNAHQVAEQMSGYFKKQAEAIDVAFK